MKVPLEWVLDIPSGSRNPSAVRLTVLGFSSERLEGINRR